MTDERKDLSKRKAELSAKAIDHDSRISFGITYFDNQADANEYSDVVKALGITYNGGFYHGMICGRDKGHDKYENRKWTYSENGYINGTNPKEEWGKVVAFAVTD